MAEVHVAAFEAGELVNRAAWHLKNALFTCSSAPATAYLAVLHELETRAIAVMPLDAVASAQQELRRIAALLGQNYPSEREAEEWQQCVELLEKERPGFWSECTGEEERSASWQPEPLVRDVFWMAARQLDETSEKIRGLFELALRQSFTVHLAFLLGIHVDQLQRPDVSLDCLFALEIREQVEPNHPMQTVEPARELQLGDPLPSMPTYQLVARVVEPGRIATPRELPARITALWGRLKAEAELPSSLIGIEGQNPSERLSIAEQVRSAVACVLGSWPEPDDEGLVPRATATPSSTSESTSGNASESETIEPGEYQGLLKIKSAVDPEDSYIGRSVPILRVFEQIANLNRKAGDQSVLILGPSGAGKTQIAEVIHNSSERRGRPFRTVQATANKGADARITIGQWVGHGRNSGISGIPNEGCSGLLEDCRGGTIFIDEVADLDDSFQVFLFQVLDRKAISLNVGQGAPVVPDVRLLFATNVDLEQAVIEKRIRHDLARRIETRVIKIPPLSERKDDIVSFVRRIFQGRKIDPEFYLPLLRYEWPGQVRELLDVLRQIEVPEEGRLALEHLHRLPAAILEEVRAVPPERRRSQVYRLLNDVFSRQGLTRGTGLHQAVADALGVSSATVSRYLRDLNVGREPDRVP